MGAAGAYSSPTLINRTCSGRVESCSAITGCSTRKCRCVWRTVVIGTLMALIKNDAGYPRLYGAVYSQFTRSLAAPLRRLARIAIVEVSIPGFRSQVLLNSTPEHQHFVPNKRKPNALTKLSLQSSEDAERRMDWAG